MAREKLACANKKARLEYDVQETYEAGIVLQGNEVKALREGRGNLQDSYAKTVGEEVFLHNFHIGAYSHAHQVNHDPLRPKKLLLHKREIRRLMGKTIERGMTLVPLRVYFSRGLAKAELGLAKGKKLYDRREDARRQEAKRDIERALRERQKQE